METRILYNNYASLTHGSEFTCRQPYNNVEDPTEPQAVFGAQGGAHATLPTCLPLSLFISPPLVGAGPGRTSGW
jgi:hypothetical protein